MMSHELVAARKSLKLSQVDLADILLTPKRTLQDWEGGEVSLAGNPGALHEVFGERQ